MYFKRIEMHGFKSFAEPVTIEFHRGVTCVIGPNGSGKSNISDAIRWVLGEQSPKMLRGGKMEEVIFSGTESRKSRGMAEVVLVIDNSAGQLPIDYNEVAITRRVFRSGESEYLINGNQCRLKDIRELIMDTGIGVDGYSLIGQGKIADIISNKTESRREIFEEAAGIVMYRTRKAESERKLQQASDNLERVNDIIGEIEGRIDGLREDSIKAREYIELRDKNKELEINITLSNIESLESKNETVKEDLSRLADKLRQAKGRREEADRNLVQAGQSSGRLQQVMEESRKKFMEQTEELNSLISRKKLSSERLSSIGSDCARLEEEILQVDEKLQREQSHKQEWEQIKASADSQLAQAGEKLEEKLEIQQELEAELTQAEQSAGRHKEDIFSIHSRISSWNGEISSLENLKDTLERRKQQLLEEQENGSLQKSGNLQQLKDLESKKDLMQQQLSAGRLALQEQEDTCAAQTMEERQLSKDLEKLRISAGELSARKKTIEEMESNYEGYNYAVKFIMKAGIKGLYGTVAELITVPRGFEVAIETALGAALQNIVCEDDGSAQRAVARLKESRAGRLTFLPVSSIRPGRSQDQVGFLQEPGFQGIGSDCIETETRYKPVIQYLLGRVVIVDTMDHAVRMSKKGSGLRFVTLEGEIINAGGAITGGRYKNKTANLLERKAEVAELEEKLGEIRAKGRDIFTAQKKLQTAIEKGRGQILHLQEQNRNLELELLGAENQRNLLKSGLEDFSQKSAKWQQELNHIREEQLSSQNMMDELNQKVRDKKQEISQKEDLAKQQLDLYDQKKQQAEALKEEITAFRIEAENYKNRRTSAHEMTQRIRHSLQELQEDRQSKEKRMAELIRERESLEAGQEGMEENIRLAAETKESIGLYLEELAEEQAQAARRTGELNREKEELQQQETALQNQKYELEIKAAKNETQLNNYKEKLWEDFEVSYIQAMEFKKEEFVLSAAIRDNRLIKNRIKELGEVNTGAIAEYETVNERYQFLTGQRKDILESADSLRQIIEDMDRTIKRRFRESFQQVGIQFEKVFTQLFGGGHAQLRLDNEKEPLESGIDIIAQPPGKKLQNINLLSGGEKTMTAIALMFAVLKTKPTPFCILDEVEAALDDANVQRFARYLKTFDNIQFTLVTHQKATMEHADVLYGVTMPEQGISKVLSLDLHESA